MYKEYLHTVENINISEFLNLFPRNEYVNTVIISTKTKFCNEIGLYKVSELRWEIMVKILGL